jgi:hypothetical protein
VDDDKCDVGGGGCDEVAQKLHSYCEYSAQ